MFSSQPDSAMPFTVVVAIALWVVASALRAAAAREPAHDLRRSEDPHASEGAICSVVFRNWRLASEISPEILSNYEAHGFPNRLEDGRKLWAFESIFPSLAIERASFRFSLNAQVWLFDPRGMRLATFQEGSDGWNYWILDSELNITVSPLSDQPVTSYTGRFVPVLLGLRAGLWPLVDLPGYHEARQGASFALSPSEAKLALAPRADTVRIESFSKSRRILAFLRDSVITKRLITELDASSALPTMISHVWYDAEGRTVKEYGYEVLEWQVSSSKNNPFRVPIQGDVEVPSPNYESAGAPPTELPKSSSESKPRQSREEPMLIALSAVVLSAIAFFYFVTWARHHRR